MIGEKGLSNPADRHGSSRIMSLTKSKGRDYAIKEMGYLQLDEFVVQNLFQSRSDVFSVAATS